MSKLELKIVPVQGWRRHLVQSQTDMPWINPSPNIRRETAALLYPGVGLLEFLKLSVGRGTDTPFEILGAPYLDGAKLQAYLTSCQLPGVRFEAVSFTPDRSVFADQACQGVRVHLSNRETYRAVDIGLCVARYLAKHHAEACDYSKFQTLLLHKATLDGVKRGDGVKALRRAWQPELQAFAKRRRQHLLY